MFDWFRKYIPKKEDIKNSRQLKFISSYLRRPELWKLERDPVARGVAIGVFIAMFTFVPFHMVIAAIVAIFTRSNLPFAIGMTWLNNPITFVPITFLNYYIGSLIIEKKETFTIPKNFSLFNYNFLSMGEDFFIGAFLLGISAAILGYIIVILLWHFKE